MQIVILVLWVKVVKEFMAKLKKRMINFFSLEKTIGYCLKMAKEMKICWNLLFIAKHLQYAEIYLKRQVNRKLFMVLPSPWDLAHDFESYLVKSKKTP